MDPRFSTAYQLAEDVALTAAWGIYHQVADPLYYDGSLGHAGLAPMRSKQAVVGLQAGRGEGAKAPVARLELYDKQYDDLAQLARDKSVVGGGTGRARGADLFLKGTASHGIGGRIAISYVDSKRTDPNTGVLARAPFDVTWSGTAVLDVPLPSGWSASGAYRYATGKPFTPVAGATPDLAAYGRRSVSGSRSPVDRPSTVFFRSASTVEYRYSRQLAHSHSQSVQPIRVRRRVTHAHPQLTMRHQTSLRTAVLALVFAVAPSTTLHAQALTGAAKWADSARREIDAAALTGDMTRLNEAKTAARSRARRLSRRWLAAAL